MSCWLAVVAAAVIHRRNPRLILFVGGCAACIFVVNVVVFGLCRVPALWGWDSYTYLIWPPYPARNPGINFIVVSLFRLLGFHGLQALQLNLILLGYLGALAWLAAATKRYWSFIPMTALPVVWGVLVVHASYVLSEAWFLTAMLMAVSGLMALAFGAGRIAAAWAGIGLLLALCAKAVGPVLVIPAVLAYRFIPGPHARRCGLLALAITPALLGYVAMSIYNYTTTGRFSLQALGGWSLAGHVAWMLDPDDLPEEYRAAGREAVERVRAVYAQMPAMADVDRYVHFTTNKYNEGLARPDASA
jgi:hypothetical protein